MHCPRCRKPLKDDRDRELRAIDLRYDTLKDVQEARLGRFLSIGSGVAAAIGLVVPLAHLGAAALIPLMIVAHLVAVRFWLIRDATRYLGRARRFFVRWLSRLIFLWIGSLGYGLSVIPVGGAVASALTFAGLTVLVHTYVLWSLGRDFRAQGLSLWEKVTLAVLVVSTLVVFAVVLLLTAAVGWSAAHLWEWARPLMPGGTG